MTAIPNINFLLVDDLESNLIALEAILKREGLTLLKARSGREALELLLVHDIALAFVDVQMPEMSGFELAELMRSTERTKEVPIIFLTAGMIDQKRRIEGYETGAVDFLLKPIDAAILLNKAATFYDLARQRQALKVSEARLIELNDRLAASNERLERADRSKDEFLAMLAHELRNPIAPILIGADILLSQPHDPALVDRIGGMMQRQTGQLARLIDDLLDVSRITMGKIELQKRRSSVREIVDSALESVMPLVETMEHRIILESAPADWVIDGDPHRLAQVIANLLSNAAKYTAKGGEIRMEIASEGDELLRISVRDNGKGISLDHQKRIFEMFDQGSSGPKDGLGIGLTLVKSLVEMHGGSIDVSSEGENKGSEFVLILPALSKNGDSSVKTASSKSGSPLPKIKVLIADDGKPTADILSMFFQLEGMETAVAYDGVDAVGVAEKLKPNLVCLDLGMPRMDGYEAAKEIRKIVPQACIVALSGWGSEEDRRRTAEAGFDDHLLKPVNPLDLRELVEKKFRDA